MRRIFIWLALALALVDAAAFYVWRNYQKPSEPPQASGTRPAPIPDPAAGRMTESPALPAAPAASAPLTPGGCNSKAACEAYCLEAAHAEECRAFFAPFSKAAAPGKEEPAAIDTSEGKMTLQAAYQRISASPLPVQQCIRQLFDQEELERMRDGQLKPSPAQIKEMESCFTQEQQEQPEGYQPQ